MEKGKFHESLVRLYLRLNGYFQTGLISHSAVHGNNATEIDILAVRFPLHSQPEREVGFCTALNPSKTNIDIIIGEVKSSDVVFNDPLKTGHALADRNWTQILNWIGLFEPNEIKNLVPKLKACADTNTSMLTGIDGNCIYGTVKIRPIIFCIERPASNNNPKPYICGDEVIDYIWTCLCPVISRVDCSTVYPLGNWGNDFDKIVTYIKKRNNKKLKKPTLAELTVDFKLV